MWKSEKKLHCQVVQEILLRLFSQNTAGTLSLQLLLPARYTILVKLYLWCLNALLSVRSEELSSLLNASTWGGITYTGCAPGARMKRVKLMVLLRVVRWLVLKDSVGHVLAGCVILGMPLDTLPNT